MRFSPKFLSGSTDRVEIDLHKFVNLVSVLPSPRPCYPSDPQGVAARIRKSSGSPPRKACSPLGRWRPSSANEVPALSGGEFLFEQKPRDQAAPDALLPLYLDNQLLRSLQEAARQ